MPLTEKITIWANGKMVEIEGICYTIPELPCAHEVINNGTRLSECRYCKLTMRLKDFDWEVEDVPFFPK